MDTNDAMSQPRSQWQITEDFIDSVKRTHGSYGGYRSYEKSAFFDALKDQLLLLDGIHDLTLAIQALRDKVDTKDLEVALLDVRSGAGRLHQFINESIGGDPLIRLPSNESAIVAQKVFETAELAEMILMELEPRDLLKASFAGKAFAASLASSKKLQVKVHLRGSPNAIWSTMFDRNGHCYPRVSCEIDSYERIKDARPREVKIKAIVCQWKDYEDDYETETYSFPELSSYHRNMLICQPPIKEMSAMPDCCYFFSRLDEYRRRGRPDPPPPIVVRSKTGLTAGDLVEYAQQLADAHRHCPYARDDDHHSKGEVRVGAYFECRTILRRGDPSIPRSYLDDPQGYSPDHYGQEVDRRRFQPTELEKYFDAKQEALTSGAPILTFEEWQKATQAEANLQSAGAEEEQGDEEDECEGMYEGEDGGDDVEVDGVDERSGDHTAGRSGSCIPS